MADIIFTILLGKYGNGISGLMCIRSTCLLIIVHVDYRSVATVLYRVRDDAFLRSTAMLVLSVDCVFYEIATTILRTTEYIS